jgi:hypothetical protein
MDGFRGPTPTRGHQNPPTTATRRFASDTPVVRRRDRGNSDLGTAVLFGSRFFFDAFDFFGACVVAEGAMAREELLNRLRVLMRNVMDARFQGSTHSKFARVHGYADGDMSALLDSGLVDQKTLLSVVSDSGSEGGNDAA